MRLPRPRWWFLLPLAYVFLAAAYLQSIPLFEGPDEPSHLEYVGFFAAHGRPPLYGDAPEVPGEGMQPPLYYMIAAPLFSRIAGSNAAVALEELHRANLSIYGYDRGALRANRLLRARRATPGGDARHFLVDPGLDWAASVRWISLVFGLLAVVLTAAAVHRATTDADVVGMAVAFFAFNPQFLFLSGIVSNDTAATSIGAASFCVYASAMRDVRLRHYLLCGLIGAVGLAVKLSTLPVVAVSAVFVFVADRRAVGTRVREALSGGGLAFLVAAPLVYWNLAHRGDLLGTGALWDSTTHLASPEAHGGLWRYFTEMYLPWTAGSYVARFGWMTVYAPWGVYAVASSLAAIGLAGFLLRLRDASRATPHDPELGLLVYLVTVLAVTAVAHVWLNVHTAQPQGRHLFPASAQVATFVALGIRRASTVVGGERWVLAAATISWMAVGYYSLVEVIQVQYP